MPYKVTFSIAEITEMRAARKKGHKSWDNNSKLKSVKKKIKDFCLTKNDDRCCYCGRNLHGEFSLVIDIEHILPKSLFLKHMFTIKNLSASCKRCNMLLKKNKVDFLIKTSPIPKRLFRSKYYQFIHPNLDNYDSHLELLSVQSGRKRLIKYSVVNDSKKGSYTYDYFKLKVLELNSFDTAQGGKKRAEIANPLIAKKYEKIKP
ncbi:HNH endonuclease [Desulfosediminicola sp.]|uniref:HNH endonuclease n=1 Tax=Desulfosediminicola sp. TaxID=2886825 RepID=UPI003AF1E5B7